MKTHLIRPNEHFVTLCGIDVRGRKNLNFKTNLYFVDCKNCLKLYEGNEKWYELNLKPKPLVLDIPEYDYVEEESSTFMAILFVFFVLLLVAVGIAIGMQI